jgi:hypothetical protein
MDGPAWVNFNIKESAPSIDPSALSVERCKRSGPIGWRQMSTENQLWGATRIHGELLKLGFGVAQSTVTKYMVKRCGPQLATYLAATLPPAVGVPLLQRPAAQSAFGH